MTGEDDAAVDHALLCPPVEKAQREAANGLEQIDYIAELVERGVVELRESHLLQLHRLAVQGISVRWQFSEHAGAHHEQPTYSAGAVLCALVQY
jgi:hypothetical protein